MVIHQIQIKFVISVGMDRSNLLRKLVTSLEIHDVMLDVNLAKTVIRFLQANALIAETKLSKELRSVRLCLLIMTRIAFLDV